MRRTLFSWLLVVIAAAAIGALPRANGRGTQAGEWRYWGGDEGSTRYSPLDQINAANVAKLEIAWRWSAANFGPEVDHIYRATPIYVKGKLYTVAGQRRTAVCIDPATGETLWMYREKDNPRWEASTRKNYGKGCRLCRGRRSRHHLSAYSGLLPACARRRDGLADSVLRHERRRRSPRWPG
jgi:glucose dehydrogenase